MKETPFFFSLSLMDIDKVYFLAAALEEDRESWLQLFLRIEAMNP
jgi:hypothetical protein